MGRRIYDDKGDFVWKYIFGEQASEQSRIVEELGIGEVDYNTDGNGDILVLNKKDKEELKDYLDEEITLNISGDKIITTRNDIIDFWKKIHSQYNGIRVGGIEELIFKHINSLFTGDIHFWRMINAFIIHMETNEYDEIELYGEY